MKRVIIITGTRKGIGHFLAEKYLSEGDIVYGCSRRECEITMKIIIIFVLMSQMNLP